MNLVEEARLQELAKYKILDTPPEDALDQVTEVAAYITQTPAAFISFVGREFVFLK